MTGPGLPMSQEAILYAFRELARRAGVQVVEPAGSGFEALGLTVRYGPAEPLDHDVPTLVVVPCRDSDWRRVTELQPGGLDWVSVEEALPPGGRLPLEDSIPVLFWGSGQEGKRRFAYRRGSSVVFACDLLASTVFMLSRWEEMTRPERDEHGRMPASASLASRQGFLDRPIIDAYALILREWLKFVLPGWTPKRRLFEVKLSHDVDIVWPFRDARAAVKTLARDLLERRSFRQARRTAALAVTQVFAPRRTPPYQGILRLSEISRRSGMQSAFYFMAADCSPCDNGYDPGSKRIRRCIAELRRRGFELGYHAGYRTLGDPVRLAAEKARLDRILGETRYGGRQHFLRFRVPDTWRDWERAGLTYDSTLTFADHEGFRCGTCHPYRPFDLEANRELELWELPLIVMDGTLRRYRGLRPDQAETRVLELARRCLAVEGTFSLLWHNSSLGSDWNGWGGAYERMIHGLAMLGDAGVSLLNDPTIARMD